MKRLNRAHMTLVSLVVCAVMLGLALNRTVPNRGQVNGIRGAQEYPTPGLAGHNVPIYPGAKQVEPPTGMAGPHVTAFETADTSYAVIDFYERALLNKGWTLYRRWGPYSTEYEWQDSRLNMPYSIHTEVSSGGASALDKGPTQILINVWPVPDPNNIPLYEHAQKVQQQDVMVHDTSSGPPSDEAERRITYLTVALPENVEAYYKQVLPQYGWAIREKPSPYFSEGATYSFSLSSGVEVGPGGIVNIVAKTQANGQTKVQLRISATHLRNWSP